MVWQYKDNNSHCLFIHCKSLFNSFQDNEDVEENNDSGNPVDPNKENKPENLAENAVVNGKWLGDGSFKFREKEHVIMK